MVHLPILTKLQVIDYEMFPGDPPGSGIEWHFQPGVTVIAGINGLGKTTLLSMILRALTGPYDLSGDGGSGQLSVVMPGKPTRLKPKHRRLFQDRVSDGADTAKVLLSATIGETSITIDRWLKDLSLESLKVSERGIVLPSEREEREEVFQSKLAELFGLGNFVDVLLVLHHVILFYENRPGALWDPNAQRQLLRALCLDQEEALHVASLERELQSADSQARNIHSRITSTESRWQIALQQESQAKGVLAKLSAEQKLLDAELLDAERLEGELERLHDAKKGARLAYERAKIEREEADGAIERLKYTSLLRHFPSMDDTTNLVLSRIMTENHCLVCNASAKEKRQELEEQVAQGCCPICGSKPEAQDNVVAFHEFDQVKLDRERERVERAKREEKTQFNYLQSSLKKYEQTLIQLESVQQVIQKRTLRNKKLRTELPDSVTSNEYENALNSLRKEYSEWSGKRAARLQELRTLFVDRKDTITAKSTEIVSAFSELIKVLLVEDARLVQVSAEPKYMQAPGQSGERVEVPAYVAEMTAAARPSFVRRQYPSEVSESQRELIDLAFRLALVKVFSGSCTFAMETPEASLDGVAMERIGQALATFSSLGNNRLVVTSNLTNVGVITAIFEESSPDSNLDSRMQRVLNLLQVAAPNRALVKKRERYNELLVEAVSGTNQ